MFYFNGIFSTEALKDLFSPEFLEKIKNRQSGLVMKILKGFNQPGSFLGSIHVNDNERVLFTIIQHNNIPRILLLDHLFHKKYDGYLKNKKLLQQYLSSKGIKLNLVQLDTFDEQFEDPENNAETESIKELFRTECLKRAAPARFTRDRFIILSDPQEKAINLSRNNFIVGPPGSGKTVALQEICRELCMEENAECETKHSADEYSEQCILLTPHIALARRNGIDLKTELSLNPWLRVLDLETLAKELDPKLNALDKSLKRGIKDFITWCHNPELGIQAKLKRRNQAQGQHIDPNTLFTMLYLEFKMLVTYPTKRAYLKAPLQNTLGSLFDNDEDSRNLRFKIYVQYVNETLIGSHIPKDVTVDPTEISGAAQRARVQGTMRGYDLSFYDLGPALQTHPKFKVLCLDEIQNFPRFPLLALLSHSARIHIAGDSNQSLYDPLANLEFVRQCLFSTQHFEETVFECSYRSSEKIAVALTNLLEFQNESCTSIGNDRTATRAIHTAPDPEKPVGHIDYCAITDTAAIEKCKLLCKDNPNYVIIVKDESELKEAEEYFKTPILFDEEMKGEKEQCYIPIILTAEEANGAEYPHTILWNGLTEIHHALEMNAKSKGTKKQKPDLKSKHNTDGQEMITAFRKAFISASRASESLIVFYNPNHKHECALVTRLQKSRVKSKQAPSLELKYQAQQAPTTATLINPLIPIEKIRQSNRATWITRCNEFLQRAYEHAEEPNKESSFLRKAKNILQTQKLNLEDVTLPEGYKPPPEYACFLSPLALIKQIAQEYNDNDIKLLLNRPFKDFKTLLFIPIEQESGTKTHLWDILFSKENSAFNFLSTVVLTLKPKEDFRAFCLIFNSQFTKAQTEASNHYYQMILMHDKLLEHKPEDRPKHFDTLNALVKKVIHFATDTMQGETSEALYYAIAQHKLLNYYTTHPESSKQTMLFRKLAKVINSNKLIEAILTDDLHAVKTMLPCISETQINACIEYKDPCFLTPLMHAIVHRKPIREAEMVKCLLTHPDIDITVKTDDEEGGQNALHMAIMEKNLGVIRLLLEHNPKAANIADGTGKTALVIAVENNYGFPIIEILCQTLGVRFSMKEINEASQIARDKGLSRILERITQKYQEQERFLENASMLPPPQAIGFTDNHPNNLSADIDITGIPKALVLTSLYMNAKLEFALLPFNQVLEQAQRLLDSDPGLHNGDAKQRYFDRVNLGSGPICMKVFLRETAFNPAIYDREQGPGSAAKAIQFAREIAPKYPRLLSR